MGLKEIQEEIIARAEKKASMIREEAEKEARKILEEAEKKASEIMDKRMEAKRHELEKIRQRELSNVKLEAKIARFKVEKEITEKVFELALEKFSKVKKEKLLKALLEKKEGDVVYSNKEDEALVKKLTNLKYGGNIDCKGGIVLENKDGTVREDLTFETIANTVNQDALKKVYDVLFR